MSRGRDMRLFVCVTTADRPKLLAALLEQLRGAMYMWPSLRVCVMDDGTEPPAAEQAGLTALFRNPNWAYYHLTQRQGKEGFWRLWKSALRLFEESGATHLVMLQDDCVLSEHLFSIIAGAMASGTWSDGVVVDALNLHRCRFNESGVYGSPPPKRMGWGLDLYPGEDVLPVVDIERIDWLDGFWCLHRSAIEKIGFSMEPITRPWKQHPHLGSGCGGQLSHRLREAGVPIYGFSHSLVKHRADVPSVMNAGRDPIPELETVRFLDDA